MATIDQVAGTGEVPVAPQPAAPPPPPPGAQPVVAADGTRRTTRRTVKRRPVPRGTVAVSGGAVVGTLLTVVYAAAGPVALVATAAGAVAIPFAIWRRTANSRTNRRATARRSARRRENNNRRRGGGSTGSSNSRSGGGLGLGNPLAGLGGGGGGRGRGSGSRSTGRSLFGAGAGGGRKGKAGRSGNPWADLGLGGGKAGKTTGAAKSGGMSKSKRRGDGSRTVGGRGGRSRQVTPKVGRRAGALGGVGGRTPKNPRGGGAGGWKPPKGAAPKNTAGGRNVSSPKNPRGGAGGGWKPPKATTPKATTPKAAPAKPMRTTPPPGNTAPPVKKVKKNRATGYGPQGRGGAYGPWTPPRRATRRGRAASRLNHGLWKAGSAFLHGVRKPNGRRAFRAAFRRYGAHGYNPTATGYLARIAGGVAAAIPAAVARLAWIAAKKVALSLRRAYNPPAPAGTAQQQNQQQNQQQTVQQPPVPAPAFSRPIQDVSPRGVPDPIGNPPQARNPHQPAPTGGGGSNSHGGNSPMTALFPPHGNASDFFASCCKWSPAGNGVDGAIWDLESALQPMVGSLALIANGWSNVIANCENGLAGGFHPAMRSEMVEVFNMLQAAAVKASDLPATFNNVYADAIARRGIRGGQTLNVR